MGQWYKFMNVDKKEVCEKNWHNSKLMEHSYLKNNYCMDILNLLSNDWKGDRILHVGEYANPEDETQTQNIVAEIIRELNAKESLYAFSNSFRDVKNQTNTNIRYVYNLDKKQYIDLFKQPIQWCYHSDKEISVVKINSFALLTGCGNGLGGGDYRGINKHLVGFWAGDRFVSSSEPLEEYKDFSLRKELYSELSDHKNLKTYDDVNKIIDLDIKTFKSQIEYLIKYNSKMCNLSLNCSGLQDEEVEAFNGILNNFKDKKKGSEMCL